MTTSASKSGGRAKLPLSQVCANARRMHRVAPIALALVLSIASFTGAARPKSKLADSKSGSATDTAQEHIEFTQNGHQETVDGRIVVEATDGGLLVESNDGALWTIERQNIQLRNKLDDPFKPLTATALAERLVSEMPAGFRSYNTPHYVIIFDTSRTYAQWTSSMLERLHKAFTNYWEGQGIELHEPEFPLPVMLFATRQEYDQASREDLPGGTGTIIGFYSLRSNRVNMFDLTGVEAIRGGGGRGSIKEINQMLSQPAAVPLVATVVHEATHQIAFNCGLQQRYADIPLWLCEGMAVYFEAPDLASAHGWRGIGRVNYPRLGTYRKNLPNWSDNSLEAMLRDSKLFRNPHTAFDTYADAWALNYYLIKYQPKAYTEYLKLMADKRPLIEDTPEARLAEFREHFGDLNKLQQDFLKQMSRVK
jgi:hypothetical protein